MTSYLNVRDIAIIGASALIVVWGFNYILRRSGHPEFQA